MMMKLNLLYGFLFLYVRKSDIEFETSSNVTDTRKTHTRMVKIIIIILLWKVNYEIDNQTECELWVHIAGKKT